MGYLKVFVSTTTELDAEARELKRLIDRDDGDLYDIIYYEDDQYLGSESPRSYMRRNVRGANAFVGLLGYRYGSLYKARWLERLERRARYRVWARVKGVSSALWASRRAFVARNRKRSWCVWEYESVLKRRSHARIGFYQKQYADGMPQPAQLRFINRIKESNEGHQLKKFEDVDTLYKQVDKRLRAWGAETVYEVDRRDGLVWKWCVRAVLLVMMVSVSYYCVQAASVLAAGGGVTRTSFSVSSLLMLVVIVALLLVLWAFWRRWRE